jgi:hypothetical protein
MVVKKEYIALELNDVSDDISYFWIQVVNFGNFKFVIKTNLTERLTSHSKRRLATRSVDRLIGSVFMLKGKGLWE